MDTENSSEVADLDSFYGELKSLCGKYDFRISQCSVLSPLSNNDTIDVLDDEEISNRIKSKIRRWKDIFSIELERMK